MVDGHELHEEDLRLMYTFDQKSGSTAQYETHSDSQVSSTSKPNKCKSDMLKQKRQDN